MNVYETVTANIINAIEQGAGEFRMPWHRASTANDIPCNAITGAKYRGSNILTLWVAGMQHGYASNRWATYKQWAANGAQVRKGEKATAGIFYTITEHEDATGKTKATPFARAFYLFNAEQVDGETGEASAPREDLTQRIARADEVITATGAKITHAGSRAFYRHSTDEIYLPERAAFIGTETSSPTEAYYSTALHELTHWTGHESRLARGFAKFKKFGDEAYAVEELAAEMGAAFLCAQLGITNDPRPDHAQYLASWLRVLKSDSKAIIRAASEAQKACDYIMQASETGETRATLAVAA
jgi:antirestriction protein ArdC